MIDLSLDSESEPVAKRRKVVAGAPGDSDRASKATAERPRLLAGFGYLKTKNTSDEANRCCCAAVVLSVCSPKLDI